MNKVIKVTAIVVSILLGLSLGVVGIIAWAYMNAVPPTGMELHTAINNYRQENGLKTLDISPELCNNLVGDRFSKLISEEGQKVPHLGFHEWALKMEEEDFIVVGEIFSNRPTLELIMQGWKDSPGHNIEILNPEYNRDCTYSSKAGALVVFGAKEK
jgi:hypothetical protein